MQDSTINSTKCFKFIIKINKEHKFEKTVNMLHKPVEGIKQTCRVKNLICKYIHLKSFTKRHQLNFCCTRGKGYLYPGE